MTPVKLTYTPVTQLQLQGLLTILNSNGIPVQNFSTEGTVNLSTEFDGIKATCTYNGEDLVLTIVDKPWEMPIALINSRIKNELAKLSEPPVALKGTQT